MAFPRKYYDKQSRWVRRMDYLTRHYDPAIHPTPADAMLEEKRVMRTRYFVLSIVEALVLFILVWFVGSQLVPSPLDVLTACVLSIGFVAWCVIGDYREDAYILKGKASGEHCVKEHVERQKR